MLGDLVYEAEGKVIGMKRLPDGKVEQTVDVKGKFFGEEFTATFKTEGGIRPDGTGYVELNGSYTMDGALIQYSGIGNGIRKPDGTWAFRGTTCYNCPPGKYARLNGIAVLWEVDVDDAGVQHNKGWEWK